jgi:hypothetical protein
VLADWELQWVAGYLSERLARRRLIPSGWAATESPLIVAGLGPTTVMTVLALRAHREDPDLS